MKILTKSLGLQINISNIFLTGILYINPEEFFNVVNILLGRKT